MDRHIERTAGGIIGGIAVQHAADLFGIQHVHAFELIPVKLLHCQDDSALTLPVKTGPGHGLAVSYESILAGNADQHVICLVQVPPMPTCSVRRRDGKGSRRE